MRTHITSERSTLYRLATARSWATAWPVEAYRADDGEPTFFAAGELLVNAADTETIDDLLRRGGRVVRAAEDPAMPDEFRAVGLGRDDVDMAGLPRTVKILFDDVPRAPENVDEELARGWPRVERMEWTSEPARALAALIAPMRAEGRRVGMNLVLQPRTLPLTAPLEGAGLVYPRDPLRWECVNQRSRIADAWHLVESMRLMRSVSPIEFIGICDTGFDPAAANDIGAGLVNWNAVADAPGLPPNSGTTFHGTEVASAAAAVVGNNVGAAGAGGTVAMPALFHGNTVDAALTTIIRCTQWGIRIVNFSFGHLLDQDDIEDEWTDTFNWAADNGVLIVCAAPNENVNLSGDQGDFPSTVSSRAIAVGRLMEDDTKADCAYGPGVDLWAPGTRIPVVPTPLAPMGGRVNGTSYAAPFVCGTAAMVRAVNQNLNADQVRDVLFTTAWTDAGAPDRGLNAYAAVLEAMKSGVAETTTEAAPERLYPAADGTFKPIFNDGFNRAGDTDTFLLDVKAFSHVTVDLRWYDRLTKVFVELERAADGTSVEAVVTYPGQGHASLAAYVGSGTYRLTVRGTGTSAYLLTGRTAPGRLLPDRFEANNSFETATRLRVLPRGKWELGGPFTGTWGPGSFDLNLHTDGTGPGTRDTDFFAIDVPHDVGVLHRAEVRISDSDEPLDVTLHDAARAVLVAHTNVRNVGIGLPLGTTVYLKVAGNTHTRYGLWVGAYLDDEVFRRLWPEVRLVPRWWEENIVDRFVNPREHRAVVITPELLADGVLALGGVDGQPLPDGVRLTLLDRDGAPVREATHVDGSAVIDLDGVGEGGYVLSADLDGAALDIARSGGLGLTMRPPSSDGRNG